MISDQKILILTLKGKQQKRVPFWFMRQAGRYLPEYRELRSRKKNFLEFCYSPEDACEATLQPIRRFGMDAAIIFSDILVVPHAMGVDVSFEEGEGPRLSTTTNENDFKKLTLSSLDEKLSKVYEALKLTKNSLPADKTLIGFAGSPWTLACYMVEGKGSKDFSSVKLLASHNPVLFSKIIDILTQAIIKHIGNQINAGAEVIQLFDSWAGVLGEQEFEKWVIAPTKIIIEKTKKNHPHIPIIGFPRQSGSKFLTFAQKTGLEAVSFDGSVPLEWVKNKLQPEIIVQGALDQILLADNKEEMLAQAKNIVSTLGDKPFVFNLAHGILPHTPVENVQALCDFLKNKIL